MLLLVGFHSISLDGAWLLNDVNRYERCFVDLWSILGLSEFTPALSEAATVAPAEITAAVAKTASLGAKTISQ
jgi:hypothetical protein